MLLHRSRIAACIGMLLVVGSAAASSALAGLGLIRCEGEPFAFSTVQTTQFERQGGHARVGWEALGATSLLCTDRILGIDVWEHAVVGLRREAGGIRLDGRILTRVRVPDGGTVLIGGVIAGSGTCTQGVCVIPADVRGRGPGGQRLRMLQNVTIDVSTGEVTDVEVLRIVIEFTSAG